MTKIKNVVDKSCSFDLVFLRGNRFQEDFVVVFCFCLSGRLPRRKESGCPIRDSASRPGVGVGNTPYQVLPSVSERAWVRTNIPNS